MKRTNVFLAAIGLLVAMAFCAVGPAYALYEVIDKGTWPKSWPKELEPLRKQASTFEGPLAPHQHYAIPFTKRGEFESAWPHILKVKSKAAHLRLVRGANFFLGGHNTGVVVHSPPAGQEDPTYIELVVDGDIVDLKRIPLPADTPIDDERFKMLATGKLELENKSGAPAENGKKTPPKQEPERAWDLTSPTKEPKYQNEPRYALLVFGPKREQRVWMVLDGTTLYVDRNGNGDLTDPGERLEPNNPKDGSNRFGGSGSHTHFDVFEFTVQAGAKGKSKFQLNHWIRAENFVPQTGFDKDLQARWLKLRWENTTLFRKEGLGQGQTPLLFMPKPADAQVCALDGPLTFVVRAPEHQALRRGVDSDLSFCIAVPGHPPRGAERQFYNPLATTEVPASAHLEVEIEYPTKAVNAPPLRRKYLLKERC